MSLWAACRQSLSGSCNFLSAVTTTTNLPPGSSESIPLVSVAIITYNQSKFLKECLESVLGQTYKNIEIVVADDCSPDDTAEVLKNYEAAHPGKFKIHVAAENGGITKNSNVAYRLCRGRYIAWMGGDDLMLPTKIEEQVRYMEANDHCDVLFHNVEVFRSEDGVLLHQFNSRNTPRVADMKRVIREKTYNCACATMTRRDRCPEAGFDERLPLSSDWKFWLETLAHGGQMHYLPKILGRYRRHAGNITHKGGGGFKRCQSDHLETIRWLLLDHPDKGRETLVALAETFRQMRWISPTSYHDYLWLSFRTRVTAKSAAALLVSFLTARRVKL